MKVRSWTSNYLSKSATEIYNRWFEFIHNIFKFIISENDLKAKMMNCCQLTSSRNAIQAKYLKGEYQFNYTMTWYQQRMMDRHYFNNFLSFKIFQSWNHTQRLNLRKLTLLLSRYLFCLQKLQVMKIFLNSLDFWLAKVKKKEKLIED